MRCMAQKIKKKITKWRINRNYKKNMYFSGFIYEEQYCIYFVVFLANFEVNMFYLLKTYEMQ